MQLSSNIFPIELGFEEFHVQRIPYQDDLLENLRRQYNQDYSFFRSGDYIYISPGKPNLENLGEVVTLNVSENLSVVASLIRHIFFRAFKEGFPTHKPSFNPFTFPSTRAEHNLVKPFLPDLLKEVITYKKLNEIFVKHSLRDGKDVFLLVVDSSYQWMIGQNCAVIKQEGLDLTELEVAVLVKHEASIDVTAPSFQAIGRVLSISEGNATIETNDGPVERQLSQLYLNKIYNNILLYIAHHVGHEKASDIIGRVKSAEAQRNHPTVTYKEIQDVVRVLARLEYKNYDGFSFTVSPISISDFARLDLETPKYLFDVALTKTSTSPSQGLNTYGPYDYGKFFEVNSPHVLVIYHKNSSGAFTQFLGWLKEGLPNSIYFSKGFLAKYRLQSIQFRCVEVDSYNVADYLAAIKQTINLSNQEFDIAIIETREDFEGLATTENPYWLTKALLIQKGITAQYLRVENARKPDYLIDGFALQMYAKLGGTPWTLPSSPNIARELIVGIGSSYTKKNNFVGSPQNRVVGISTFFNSDGRYLLTSRSKEVSYSDYFEELLRNLKASIDKISGEQGWQEGEIVRIIFHVFKPMKNLEVDVVAKLIQEYSTYDIKFAFISFGERNPFMLFDLDQEGVLMRSGFTKGKYVPQRGTNILLERGLCLLQVKGPRDVKTDKQGFIPPLLIRIHPNSTFSDTTYLVQQVYRLTNISYRTFMPSQLPVTLFYASLITDQLNNLSMIPGWDSDFIKQLRNKKWFL